MLVGLSEDQGSSSVLYKANILDICKLVGFTLYNLLLGGFCMHVCLFLLGSRASLYVMGLHSVNMIIFYIILVSCSC